jgi:hypothetical protein
MITIGADGWPKPARVGIAVVDGKLWSSGIRIRRAPQLRHDLTVSLRLGGPTVQVAWMACDPGVCENR